MEKVIHTLSYRGFKVDLSLSLAGTGMEGKITFGDILMGILKVTTFQEAEQTFQKAVDKMLEYNLPFSVTKKITGKEIAEMLFKRHTHAEMIALDNNPDQIVYREKEVISLLKELGYPEPDWDALTYVSATKDNER